MLEQCRGFFQLRDEFANEIQDPQNTQTVKQADVLMLFYLLPDQWPLDVLKVNWDYYEPRTVHASSLSHAVHGILAAELGLRDKAETYMRRSLGMDLHDEMNNAAHGAHMAANGMNWAATVRGFGGVARKATTSSSPPASPPAGSAWPSPCAGAARNSRWILRRSRSR